MDKWEKLQPAAVAEKYLVSPAIAHKPNNTFYGRKTNASIPVDEVGQVLALLNDDNGTMTFHFATLASQFHEWFDDYDPLNTPYFGQYMMLERAATIELSDIIRKESLSLNNSQAETQMFQRILENNLPFSPIHTRSDNSTRTYYRQIRNPIGETEGVGNYLLLSRQEELFMTVYQVPKQLGFQKTKYEDISRSSRSALVLDRSGAEELCQILEDVVLSS